MSAAAIADALRSRRLRYGSERQLQDDVERVLAEIGIDFQREHRIGGDPIDFYRNGVGIECKVQGGPSAVLEQLIRYADDPAVTALILVTSRRTHRFGETALLGKPLLIVWVAANSL